MYVVPRENPEIRLIGHDGSVSIYANYQEFLRCTDYFFAKKHIITTFKEWTSYWRISWTLGYKKIYPRYVVRDEFGSVFSQTEILHDIKEFRRLEYLGKSARLYDFVFRATPVPYTGKKRWRFKQYYKRPKTTQERRWGCAHKKYVRGKRRSHILPNSYDDYIRGDVDNRKCWKSSKKTKQWM